MTARCVRSVSGSLQLLLRNRWPKVYGAATCSQKHTYTPPPAQYGGRHTVTLIPGDGIGPELANHVRELFRFCCVPVDFEVVNVDSTMASEDDINNAIMAIRRNGVAPSTHWSVAPEAPAGTNATNWKRDALLAVAEVVVLAVILVMALLGNGLVLVVLLRRRRHHNPLHQFMLNLCLADLVVALRPL